MSCSALFSTEGGGSLQLTYSHQPSLVQGASVWSCLSLLSSPWEGGCKCAEKPACAQEAEECLQNK